MVRQNSLVRVDGATWRSLWLVVVGLCSKIMFRQEIKDSLQRISKGAKE